MTTPFAAGRRLFRYAVVADSHLNPRDAGNTSPWQTNHLANPRNQVVVAAINKLSPSFTIHVGDVVHPLPHTTDYDGAADFAVGLYQGLEAPFYIAPGNHDIGDKHLPGNPAACISADTCRKYEQHFGPQWQVFEHESVSFLIINACLLGSGLPEEAEQWAFLEQQLEAAAQAGRRVFMFSHYPPFVAEPDEDDHYDNMDRAPRQRLLQLLAGKGVEALFAGHVHTFFLNRHQETWSYALPSSTNFRQDYAELFRVEPGEELGRNDLGKFGFFLVDVHERGHIARFVRTYGATDMAESGAIALQVGGDVREHGGRTVGADFCQDWTRIEALPYNAPLDAFVRKRVRNDYFVLNLWDAGLRSARVPIQDVMDDHAYSRLCLLRDLGHRLRVFGVALPTDAQFERLAALGESLESFEWVGPEHLPPAAAASAFTRRSIPLYLAPIVTPSSHAQEKQFDHTMSCGLALDELAYLPRYAPARGAASAGVVLRIAGEQPVLESVRRIMAEAGRLGVAVSLHVKLGSSKSAVVHDDDARIAARVAEAVIAAAAYPQALITLDTFMDIDRGYFARHGLVDRRNNPRLAADWARRLSERLRGEAPPAIAGLERGADRCVVSLVRGGETMEIRMGPGAELGL